MIVSATWSLTVGGLSGPRRVGPSCLRTVGINDETGAEIGGDTVDASVVANSVVGVRLTPTTEAMGGKLLESM
jgi:hypothetical protein